MQCKCDNAEGRCRYMNRCQKKKGDQSRTKGERKGHLILNQKVPIHSWSTACTTKEPLKGFFRDVFRCTSLNIPHTESDVSSSVDEDIIFIRALLGEWLINTSITHDPINEPRRENSLAGVKYSPFEVRRNPDGHI